MNDEQRANRLRLADGLEKVAEEWLEHFDMSEFVSNVRLDQLERHLAGEHPVDCGTVACALGWAPYLLGESHIEETWGEYAQRVLGMSYDEYTSLFVTVWGSDLNDPLPVAAKLRASVDGGVQ